MEVVTLGMWSVTQGTAECQDLDPASKQLNVDYPGVFDQIPHNSCLLKLCFLLPVLYSQLPASFHSSFSIQLLPESLICDF